MATIRGTNQDDTLRGTRNDDSIFGFAGEDRLLGQGADDTLFGGRGDDRLDGGEGRDTVSVRDAPDVWRISLTEGLAEREENVDEAEVIETDRLVSVENIDGSAQNDSLDGNAQANVINGNGGFDVINGGGGADRLRGGADNDFFRGGPGNDVIDGGAGADSVDYGFQGNAALRLDLASGRAVRGSEVDTLVSIEGATGTEAGDVLLGNGSANQFIGLAGNDRIEGRGGADFLSGDAGNDTISGGDGADELFGFDGNDRLTGGSGADLFSFIYQGGADSDAGADIIRDFSRGQGDKITAPVFTDSGDGIEIPFDQFDTNDNGRIDNADGSSRVEDLRFNSAVGGSTVLSVEDLAGEGQGNGLQITVEDVTNIQRSDFVF